MTDIERNKRLAVRWLELVSAGDIEEMRRMTSPTWTMEGGPPNLPAGHEGLRVLFDEIGEIEQTWTIDDVIAEGDKVVVRATNHCTQESFFGVPGAASSRSSLPRSLSRSSKGSWRAPGATPRTCSGFSSSVPGSSQLPGNRRDDDRQSRCALEDSCRPRVLVPQSRSTRADLLLRRRKPGIISRRRCG